MSTHLHGSSVVVVIEVVVIEVVVIDSNNLHVPPASVE